ncbi:MAG: YabP/YqfC family sporulation protein [Oscillospiraceae bacterium]
MSFAEKILQTTQKALYMNTNVVITDNKCVEIDNCKKILEYDNIYIKIQTVNMIIEVWGSDLSIENFSTDGIAVNGKINNVELSMKTR